MAREADTLSKDGRAIVRAIRDQTTEMGKCTALIVEAIRNRPVKEPKPEQPKSKDWRAENEDALVGG
jgi:hypothetical protein